MKIKKQEKSRKKIVLPVVALLLVSIVATIVFLAQKDHTNKTPTTQSTTPQQTKTPEPTRVTPEDKKSAPNTDSQTTLPKENSTNSSIALTVSSNISGNSLYIRGGIDGSIVTEGQCYALLSGPNGESIRKDTVLLQNPSTTDCKTIVIDTGSLKPGKWKITLHYELNSTRGVSNETTIEIK